MKRKFTLWLLVVLLTITFTACTNSNNSEGEDYSNASDMSSSEISDKLLEAIQQINEYDGMYIMKTEINSENMEMYLGKNNLAIKDGYVVVPAMMSIAFQVAVVTVENKSDVDKIKKDIKNNADPARWIYVWVEKENVLVESAGDKILLVMTNEVPQKIVDAFKDIVK